MACLVVLDYQPAMKIEGAVAQMDDTVSPGNILTVALWPWKNNNNNSCHEIFMAKIWCLEYLVHYFCLINILVMYS